MRGQSGERKLTGTISKAGVSSGENSRIHHEVHRNVINSNLVHLGAVIRWSSLNFLLSFIFAHYFICICILSIMNVSFLSFVFKLVDLFYYLGAIAW